MHPTIIITENSLDVLVRTRAKARYGFVTDVDVSAMANHGQYRLISLLVRCGGKRFVAPAANVTEMIAAVEMAGDYVRDVSFPAAAS